MEAQVASSNDNWGPLELWIRGTIGMLAAAFIWSFGYQFLIIGLIPVSNPPSASELALNALAFSGGLSLAGVVPVLVVVLALKDERRSDPRPVLRAVLLANGGCGVLLLAVVLVVPAILLLIPLGAFLMYLALIV